MRSKLGAAVLLTFILTAAGLAAPTTAQAAEISYTKVKVRSENRTSTINFEGRIKWVGTQRARLTGELNDECPGDGASGLLLAGASRSSTPDKKARDNRTCDARGTVPVKMFFKATRGQKLTNMIVTVCRDFSGAWRDCKFKLKYNPN